MSVKKRRTKLQKGLSSDGLYKLKFVSDIERLCDTDGHRKLKLEYMWFNHLKSDR
ncbi:hypothetical protein GCM10022297_15740 [Lactobacillus hamsteri]